MSINACSCVTWVREETNKKITQGMVGAIIETKEAARVCTKSNVKVDELTTGYGIIPNSQKNLAENTYVIENCPAGTRGRVIKFIKERDAGQHIWNYVEFEMDDPRLKQKYRIIRMMGLRGNGKGTPWDKGGDFRVVKKME